MVEVRAAQVEAFPAKEFHPGRIAGYGKRERLAPSVFAQAMAGHRVDGDLVGDWPQGRQRAAALHHYAGIRLFDEGQSDFIAQGVGGVGTAAALQVDQGMGERNVVFADELVVVDDVSA